MSRPPKKQRPEAYTDFDGEKINEGKNYRDYKAEAKQKKAAWVNPCKHVSVMITRRCRCCSEVTVEIVKGMVK